jgi:hypothetical protein
MEEPKKRFGKVAVGRNKAYLLFSELDLGRSKAGYSIETAIVMIVVFSVILFLMFMTFVMYEQVRLNTIAQETAERGAIIYAVQNKEMITGRIEGTVFSDQNPYWRMADVTSHSSNGAKADNRVDRIREYALLKLNAYKLDNNRYPDDTVTVKMKNYYIYKRVCVNIEVDYKVPFGGILKAFIDNPYHIKAYAEATVSEPAEFIRTIDLGSDLINSVAGGTTQKYKGAIQKALNWINSK